MFSPARTDSVLLASQNRSRLTKEGFAEGLQRIFAKTKDFTETYLILLSIHGVWSSHWQNITTRAVLTLYIVNTAAETPQYLRYIGKLA